MLSTRMSLLAVAFFLALGACSSGPPEELLRIESTAEEAYDKALAADVTGVAADAETLDRDWRDFRAEAVEDGVTESTARVMDAAIAALRSPAASGDRVPLARKANAVSEPMDELFVVYDPEIPASVLSLDYLGREVVLDGMSSDFDAAGAHLDAIEVIWRRLRPGVVDEDGSTEAGDFDGSIDALRDAIAAGDGPAAIVRANELLELVDVIEQVYDD